jgi:hypothetical protein
MKGVFIGAVIALILSLEAPQTIHAQETNAKSGPLGAIGVGWTYLWADQGAGERVSLNGWYVRPSFNVGKGYSVFANSTNYYGANKRGSINSHGFTFGVAKQFFTERRVRPSIFAEAGDVRSSNAGRIVNQFVFASGASLQIPVSKHLSLTATPAEWVFRYPNSNPRNDFNAKAGISIPFGKR